MDGGRHSSFPPPLPPTSEDGRLEWLRLLRSHRVGIATFFRLLEEHGSATAALDALPDIARAAGMTDYAPCSAERAESEMRRARKIGAQMLCIGEENYPEALLDLPDPPPILWARGQIELLERPAIAVVGARNASSLGLRMARKLGRDLGLGHHVIVSGMARGVDAEAHKAALELGTIAVLGGGVDVVYPRENKDLYHEILYRGLLLSEQPIGLAPKAQHFPRRNRIIAGLSRTVVVVEGAVRSGTLITARDALDIGRDVMAVPGHPLDPRASGPNQLLRDGAVLIRNARDVIDALPELPRPAPAAPLCPASTPPPERPAREIATLHQQILERIGASAVPEEQVLRDCQISPREAARAFTDLELDGEIERSPGGMITRLH